MAYLNIPLHQGSKTTRRPRRVVWLLSLFSLFLFSCVFLAQVWYRRDTLSSIAPADTSLIIRLTPNQTTWKHLRIHLADWSFVSNRHLLLSDLQPFYYGELALYISKDGSHQLGMRLKNKEALPKEFLAFHGLTAFQRGNRIVLSSSAITPEIYPSVSWIKNATFIPWFSKNIGTITLTDTNQTGLVRRNKNKVDFIFSEKTKNRPVLEIPEGAWAGLSTPVLSNNVFETLEPFRVASGGVLSLWLDTFLSDLKKQGAIWLIESREYPEQSDVLIKLTNSGDSQTIIDQLTSISGLSQLSIDHHTLSDGSVYQELVAHPERVSVEELIIVGNPVWRIHLPNKRRLYILEQDAFFLLSTNEFVLAQYLGTSSKNRHSLNCSGNQAFIDLFALKKHTRPPSDLVSSQFTLPNTLSSISLSTNRSAKTFSMCF